MRRFKRAEAESKEKHGVWDPVPELTIISPYVHSRADSNIFTMGNAMPEAILTLCQSRRYPPVRDFGFGLRDITIPKYTEQNEGRILKGSLLKLLRDSKI